jgi:hypothetical protein
MKLKLAVITAMAVAMVLAVTALGHEVEDVALGCGGATAVADGFAAGQYQIGAKVYRDGALYKTTSTTITSTGRSDRIPFGVTYDTTGKHDWRVVFYWYADGVNDQIEGTKNGLDCTVPCHCTTSTVTVTTPGQTTTLRETVTVTTPAPPAQTVTVTTPGTTVTVPTEKTVTVEKPVEKIKTVTKTKWKTKTVVKWKTRWKVKFQIKWRLHPDPYPTQCKCGPGERRGSDGKCHHIVYGKG